MRGGAWLALAAGAAVLGGCAWLTDFVTLQGERTVYTADCRGGSWQGDECTGTLAAGNRYRFRALKAHREVLFWTVGSAGEPSGKFSDCTIQDGRNWICPAGPALAGTITREMVHGVPAADPSGLARPFHPVPKWRWMLLRYVST